MTIPLTEEQQAIQAAARALRARAARAGLPGARAGGGIDRELVREMGALGLIGVDLPEGSAASAWTA